MKNQIRLATFGIRDELGPMWLEYRGTSGRIEKLKVVNSPKSLSLDQLPRRVRQDFGMSSVELMEQNLSDATDEERTALPAALKREGVSVGLVGLSRAIGDVVDSQRAEDIKEVERLISLAAAAKAEQVRVVLMPPPIVPQVSRAPFEVIVESLQRLVETAKAAGVRLMLENDDAYTADPSQLLPLLDAVGPDLGLVLDTGNLEPVMSSVVAGFMAGKEPENVADASKLYAAIETLLPRAEVVHVKTYGYFDDGRSKVYDINRVIQIIADSGFHGPLTIEFAGADSTAAEYSIKRTAQLLRDA